MNRAFEVFFTEDGYPGADPPLVFPVRDAEASFTCKTATGFLARAGWHFDLPAICLINGECYVRAEWPTRALPVNDNVGFISRRLGSPMLTVTEPGPIFADRTASAKT